MTPPVTSIDAKVLHAGIAKAQSRLRVWEFYRTIEEKSSGKTEEARVKETAEQAYGIYCAVMDTLAAPAAASPLAADDSIERRLLNLYALNVGFSEAEEKMAEKTGRQTSRTSVFAEDTVNMASFGFGLNPANYQVALDSLIKYNVQDLKRTRAPAAAQQRFISTVLKSIAQEIQDIKYADAMKKSEGLRLEINGRRYAGFSREEKKERAVQSANGADADEDMSIETLKALQPKRVLEGDKPDHHYLGGGAAQQLVAAFTEHFKALEYFDTVTKLVHPRAFPRFYIIAGPPGTGKTTAAVSCAETSGCSYVIINAAEIASPLQHQTMRSFVKRMREASKMREEEGKPGVLVLIDEGEILFPQPVQGQNKDGNETPAAAKTMIDGTETDYRRVLVITTNYPDHVDAALVQRAKMITVGYPQTDAEVVDIQRKVIQKAAEYAQKSDPRARVFADFAQSDFERLLPFTQQNEAYKAGRVISDIFNGALFRKVVQSTTSGAAFTPVSIDEVVAAYKQYTLPDEFQRYAAKSRAGQIPVAGEKRGNGTLEARPYA